MQLKQFYNRATKVSSRKSATTFGDLPDWWGMLFTNISYFLLGMEEQIIRFCMRDVM